MPIPNDRESWDYDELVDAYEKLGWKRKILVKKVDYKSSTDQIILQEILFDVTDPRIKCACVKCTERDLYFIISSPTAIQMCCAYHRVTQALPWDSGTLISETEISFEEGEAILKRTGQIEPASWRFLRRRYKPYIVRRRV